MVFTLNEVNTQYLPSPPLSPVNDHFTQLPSHELLPSSLSLFPSLPYNNEAETEIDNEEFDFSEREIEYLEEFLGFSIERPGNLTKEEILRSKFMNMMEEGVEINGEITPYFYAIEILHNIGKNIINKKTQDAVPLCVYENGTDSLQEFWVHPIFLSLQSFQFFKLFEENKENNEQDVIEIEVPSLKSFSFILYWLYTGDNSKLLEIAKLDENFYESIMINIEQLEINMFPF